MKAKELLMTLVVVLTLVLPAAPASQAMPGPTVAEVARLALEAPPTAEMTFGNAPVPGGGGMPPRPAPVQAIPYHEAGRPSRATAYTTAVTQLNAEGEQETVALTGVDAMVADGLDPLAGNHTLVQWDKLLFSAYDSVYGFALKTLGYYTPTLGVIAGTVVPLGSYQANDIAAGDLNGDGLAEEIAAWIGPGNHLFMSIGEMPGAQRATSAPAVVAAGSGAALDGYALDFDGVDDYVAAGEGISLAGSPFTVAFWARRDTAGTDDFAVGHGEGGANEGLHLGFLGSNDRFRCSFHSNDLDTPEAYTDTDWHHWACTYDPFTNVRAIYRDGLQVAMDKPLAGYQGSGALEIGRYLANLRAFDGLIDEVGIWNVARAQTQIQADMIRSTPDMTDLEAYWHFDDGPGAITAADVSGNGHVGTLYGPPVWTAAHAPVGDLHLLVRGYDEALWRCIYDVESDSCLSWDNAAGGLLASGPAAVSRGPGQFDVFALGFDGLIYQQHWDVTGWWSDWVVEPPDPTQQLFAGTMPAGTVPRPDWDPPAAVARDGGIDLFRVASDNTLRWRRSDDGTTWGAWQNLGGMLASGPGAVSLGATTMQVFARGADEALWMRSHDGAWGAWERVPLDGMDAGVTIASSPAAISPAAGEIVVYVRGSDDQLWSVSSAGGSWGTWGAESGGLASGVGAAMWGGGRHLFALTADGRLQHSEGGTSWAGSAALAPQVTYDTGVVTAAPASSPTHNFDVDVATGHLLANGHEQVVVAYRDAADDNLYHLQVVDAVSGFEPAVVSEVAAPVSTGGALRLTTGDLDGDGRDEIVSIRLVNDTYHWQVQVWSAYTETLNLREVTTPTFSSGRPFQWTLNITAGDFDADGRDEIATSHDWGSYDDGLLRYHAIFYIFDDLDEDLGLEYSHDSYYGVSRDPGVSYALTGFALVAGDVDGDGADEIVRTWPTGFASADWPHMGRNLEVLDATSLTAPTPQASVYLGWSDETYADALVVGDLDRDLVDEIALLKARSADPGEGSMKVHVYEYLPSGSEEEGSLIVRAAEYPNPVSPSGLRSTKLVAADTTGDSIRVGPPTYRVQSQMITPEVLLNLPPMHRDIVSGAGEIQIFNGAQATHSAANTTAESSTTESKREWSLSTELETSVGACGHKVTASLTDTYGENFRDSITKIGTVEFEDATTAAYYDQVIYNATDYGIWEYPVYGVPEDGEEGRAISVVFPLVSTTNQPVTEQGRLCDENFYAPSHQTYNVWSYDPFGTAEDFDDYDSLIEGKQTAGGTDFSVSMSAVSEENRSTSFHNQFSAGLEYEYENELEVPLIGKAWDVSFRAKAEGSYGLEGTSTLSTSFAEESAVGVDFPGTPDPSNYAIRAYLYWAKAGYLVVDYQTNPSTGGSWGLYTKPDPAFILPWYGFPDPATGVFPSPPDPDAPPCGLDKQLFTHDIDLDPGYVQNGDTVTMTATVRNFSNVNPGSDVVVRFYLGAPGASNQIGLDCTIPKANLDRDMGPQQCSTTWVVSGGSGEEKIHAVIDPFNDIDEMHDGDEVIDNNIGYGLLYIASADYFDPGLRQAQAYQAIVHEDVPGLGFGLYLPTTNISDTVRYELVPTSLGALRIVGDPIQALAFLGGEAEPDEGHVFAPVPAAMVAFYRDSDLLPGMDEGDLTLYRLDGTDWVPAACPGYEAIRFAADNRVAVPICQTGVFVLSDQVPGTIFPVYLPLVLRNVP